MKASHLMAIESPIDEIFRKHYSRDGKPHKPADGEDKIWRFEIPSDLEPFADRHRDVIVMDATSSKLSRITDKPDFWFNLNYDFGDDWWVTLKLEAVFEDETITAADLPRVIEGEGFGIVEDVGGVCGLSRFAKAFKKKKGAKYREYCKWYDTTEFDIEAFDLDDMNFRIKKIPRIYKQCYEDNKYPTKQSIDLIERKYKTKPKI
jgi:hypothetical protein